MNLKKASIWPAKHPGGGLRLALAALLAAGVTSAKGMTVAELQGQLAQGAKIVVIDVRGPVVYARSHIPGAINIPASLCEQKKLPPMGKVIVCGEGLAPDATAAAAVALGKKAGITAELLDGGFAAWESANAMTTAGAGLKPEPTKYISYAQLKNANPAETVLIDLRKANTGPQTMAVAKGPVEPSPPLTDLAAEFPGMKVATSPFAGSPAGQAVGKGGPGAPLLVLIDSGDGAAQTMARTLKANGITRCMILAGGEAILGRQGQPGLQRSGSAVSSKSQPAAPAGATK